MPNSSPLSQSAIYVGQVIHKRFQPRKHSFNSTLYMLALDVDEIEKRPKNQGIFGFAWYHPLRFVEKDYLRSEPDSLSRRIKNKVMQLEGYADIERILMVVQVRCFGLYFSPVNFYFCYDKQQQCTQMLAEVSNTPWNERHYYLQTIQQKQRHFKHDKAFHVSPFNPIDMQYHWQITPPNNTLLCQITNFSQQQKVFSAWLKLYRYDLTKTWRRQWLIRTPWQNVQNLMRIYWHALRLLIKRVPIHHHPGTKDNNA